MKKNFLKRIAAVATAALMAISLLPSSAMAATSTATIDKSLKGSLELTKQRSDDNSPLEGVGYTLYKIADIDQTASGLVYTSLMRDASNGVVAVPAISSNTNADALYAQIDMANSAAAGMKTVAEDFTDSTGKVSFASLDLGVYLVYESTQPAGATAGQSFILSVPMSVKDSSGDITEWNYDIEATPKNNVTDTDIDKVIVDGTDNDVKANDYNIGDSVPYKVTAGVPANVATLASYILKDTLSTGLTFNNDLVVKGMKSGVPTTLVAGTDYTLTVAGQVVTVTFVPTKLAGYDSVVANYSATLNSNAAIGPKVGNANDVELYYKTTSGVEKTVKPTIKPIAYTYEIEVTKTDEASAPLAGVEFKLYKQDGTTAIKVAGTPGAYKVDPTGASNTVITDGSGKISIKGLAAGTYKLVETKTLSGFTLLKDAVSITITSTGTADVYTLNASGDHYKITAGLTEYYTSSDGGATLIPIDLTGYSVGDYFTVDASAGDVYTSTNGVTGTKVVDKYIKTASANGLTVKSNYTVDAATGTIKLTIINKKGFDLPATGGMGTYIFTIGGIVILLAAVVLMSKKRKAAK